MGIAKTPKVAVLVDTSSGWGRRLIRGVSNFVKKHESWDIWVEPRGRNETLRLPEDWKGQGVIARVSTRQMAEHLSRKRAKIVNVSTIGIPKFRFAQVSTCESELARVALEHFIDRGIRHLGYVGLRNRAYSLSRQSKFVDKCTKSHLPCEVYFPRRNNGAGDRCSNQAESLAVWLERLPKPIGILTWGINLGFTVLRVARSCGYYVPDDVAVLSSDDDELLCEVSQPTLSGIITPSEQTGYEAASVLADALNGRQINGIEKRLSPLGVNARSSTDVLAVDDPDVVAAVRFIRSNADKPLQVADVADAVATSRRVLERRFLREFNRSLGEEISRVHLDRAKYLLANTDLPIPKVADASGYGSPEYFYSVFRKHIGCSPLKYRIQCQGR